MILAADYRPAATHGDLYRAAQAGAPAIGLIDGVFGDAPSVWHREILWALARSIPVYGAASMGALRAVELAAFGMIGVGRIYRAFRDGALEADDAVAVIHAPAALGSRPLSDALVDICATLAAAGRAAIVSPVTRRRLASLARALHYRERSYGRLLDLARQADVPAGQVEALAAFVKITKLSQKARDATALLRRMRADQRKGWTCPPPQFGFRETAHWSTAVRSWSNPQ